MRSAVAVRWVPAVAHAQPSATAVPPRSAVRIRWPVDNHHPEQVTVHVRARRCGTLAYFTSRSRCVYARAPLLNSLTRWQLSEMRRLRVVSSPSTPTGPRAWMREVEMPT